MPESVAFEAPQSALLQQEQPAFLAAADQLAGIGQQHRSSRSQVEIQQIQLPVIGGGDPAQDRQVRADVDETGAQLIPLVEVSISSHEVEVAVVIGGGAVAGLLDAASVSSLCRAQGILLLKRFGREGEDPPRLIGRILMRAKRHIDQAF